MVQLLVRDLCGAKLPKNLCAICARLGAGKFPPATPSCPPSPGVPSTPPAPDSLRLLDTRFLGFTGFAGFSRFWVNAQYRPVTIEGVFIIHPDQPNHPRFTL